MGMIDTIRSEIRRNDTEEKTLFLVSAYSIGKERLLLRLADEFGVPVFVEQNKTRKKLQCVVSDEQLSSCFTITRSNTWIHSCRMGFCGELWPYFRPNYSNLQSYLDDHPQYSRIVGFIPSGWAAASKWNRKNSVVTKGNMTVCLVPYSEHSNFNELMRFTKFIKPRVLEP